MKPKDLIINVVVPIVIALIAAAAAVYGTRTNALDDIERAKQRALEEIGVMPGEIRAFAGEQCPKGWLECDGAPVERSEHPKLSGALGDLWGAPDSRTINLPDLQGVFLRGWTHRQADDRLKDPDAERRLAIRPNGSTKNRVGSFQPDSAGPHKHAYQDRYANGAIQNAHDGRNPAVAVGNADDSRATGQPSPEASETRPKNVYVLYCIKAG